MIQNLLIHLVLTFLLAKCLFCASTPPSTGNSEIDECVKEWIKSNNEITSRFSRAQMTAICQRRQNWANGIERAHTESGTHNLLPGAGAPPSTQSVLTPDQLAYWRRFEGHPSSAPAPPGGPHTEGSNPNATQSPNNGKALRKEYRVLTDHERASYHAAVKQLKTILVDKVSRYDIFILVHSTVTSPSAHFGHSFLPFHREFLKRYELALREIDPSVALPYWDSSLDQPLPNPVDSIMWTKNFIGTANGKVVAGPFSNWTLSDGMLERNVSGEDSRSMLYKDSDVQFALNRTTFDQFSWCVDETFEGAHGSVHVAVGGHMGGPVGLSPSDPIFYMHHCFVDYMWEQFRQSHQTPAQREQDYPKVVCKRDDTFYRPDAPMKPFDGMNNKDGLSNRYTDELYSYQERPVCHRDCKACTPKSPYLFCDKRSHKCMAKVRPGGDCIGFDDQDVCYNSKCSYGRCRGGGY